ncbi:MAG: cation:proton antiporter [Thermocladium sp.]
MSDVYYALITVGILVSVSKIIGVAFERIGINHIVGEILGGMIMGPYAAGLLINTLLYRFIGFNLIDINDYVLAISDIALIFLIFSSGVGEGFAPLRRSGGKGLVVAVGGAAVPFMAAYYYYFMEIHDVKAAMLLGATFMATSTAVVVKLLDNVENRNVRELIYNAVVLDDVVGIVSLAVVLTLATASHVSIRLAIETAVALVAVWTAMLVASLMIIPRAMNAIKRPELIESSSLAAAFAMSGISVMVGLSPVVGAYLAGISVGESLVKERARSFSQTLESSLGPLFFATLGAEVPLQEFLNPSIDLGVLIVTSIAVATKALGAMMFSLPFTRKPRDSALIGAMMIPRGEVGLVIAATGYSMGIITPQLYSETVLMIMATTLLGPLLAPNRRGHP